MYRQNDEIRWNLSYNRYFIRPNFDELNPFRVYNSTYSYTNGNPLLRPAVFQSIKLGNTFRNLSSSLLVSFGKDIPNNIAVFDSVTKVQAYTISNFLTYTNSSLALSYELAGSKKWNVSALLINSLSIVEGNDLIKIGRVVNFNTLIILDVAYTLDKQSSFFVQANIIYNTPSVQNYQYRISRPDYTFELKKSFNDRRLNISLKFNDMFRIGLENLSYEVNEVRLKDVSYMDTQSVSFELSYNFGNRNININQKDSGLTGESRRYKRR